MEINVFRIDGAVVMSALERDGDALMFPKEHDKSYKYAFVWGGFVWACKSLDDGASIAISLIINGVKYSALEILSDMA